MIYLGVDQELERQVPQHEAEPGEGVRRRLVRRQGVRGDAAHEVGADGLRRAVEMEQHGNGLVYGCCCCCCGGLATAAVRTHAG